eukprot:5986-Heterococcus_DN1.PRE.2
MARKKGSSSAATAKSADKYVQLWRSRHLQDHNIDEPDAKGETLLQMASVDTRSFLGSSDTVVKQLLQEGADCNLATTPDGYTPLMLASTAEIASCLLDNGADIARECTTGRTALHLACDDGRLAVVKTLLKRGAEQHILKT